MGVPPHIKIQHSTLTGAFANPKGVTTMSQRKAYIGTKIIKAEPMEKDGVAGYKVIYPDG